MKTRAVVIALLFLTGLWIRTWPSAATGQVAGAWLPWANASVVTVYFTSESGFFPVSRRLPNHSDVARAAAEAVIAGPPTGSGLPPLQARMRLVSFSVSDGLAQVDLAQSGPAGDGDIPRVRSSMIETLGRVPGIHEIALTVNGTKDAQPSRRRPLLYFASARGLAAVAADASAPPEAIRRYLAGAPDTLTGLPRDVRLLAYAFNADEGLVSLNFSYTPSVRALAIEKPDLMRFVLLGLVTSLTEFAEVQAVRIDFEGRAQLGLGQCSDLLRTPQPRPRLLNDERLIGS